MWIPEMLSIVSSINPCKHSTHPISNPLQVNLTHFFLGFGMHGCTCNYSELMTDCVQSCYKWNKFKIGLILLINPKMQTLKIYYLIQKLSRFKGCKD